jgi:hypothetical protein
MTMTGDAATDVTVTVASSDPSKLLFSLTPNGAAVSSLDVSIPTGHNQSTEFYVQALSNVGTVGYTATASGFGPVNGTVTLGSSGFVIQSPGGVGAASFQAPVSFGPANLIISTGLLNSGGGFAETQLVASTGSVSVTVISGNTSVGTISTSPITIAGGSSSASTSLQPVTNGSTSVTVSAPQFAPAQVNATFTNSNLVVDGSVTVGQNLQQSVNLILPQPAGASGTQVTIQSDSANMNLAANATDAGTGSIVVTILSGQSSAQFFVQALTNTGTAHYTASTAGIGSASGTATFAKSGIVIQPSSISQSISASTTASATVFTALLSATGAPVSPQALAGGPTALAVPIQSSNQGVATVPATVSILPGSNSTTATISLVSTGTTNIFVSQPSGFSTPTSLTSATLTVNP